jgi:hypothetical protein
MPVAKKSTPLVRANRAKLEVDRVRRRYKKGLRTRKRLMKFEEAHVLTMVVILQLGGYSRTQMAQVIGISRGQVREFLDAPEAREMLVTLRQRLPQAALELLHGYMIEAVQAIVDVMRSSADDKYILQAAGEVLDRAGLPKSSRQERHNINDERMTVTDDGLVDRLREASPEVQEEAAQIIERLEELLVKSASEEPVDGESG